MVLDVERTHLPYNETKMLSSAAKVIVAATGKSTDSALGRASAPLSTHEPHTT